MTDNSGEDVGRSHLVVRMKFKDSVTLKRWKRDIPAVYSRVRIKSKRRNVRNIYIYSKTVPWLSTMHKDGSEQCFIYTIQYGCYRVLESVL